MEEDYNPRDILKRIKTRQERNRTQPFEWRVQVHIPVEDVLSMVQNRNNPLWRKPTPEPYTVTANFDTLQQAQEYAYMVRLRGKACTITNNWTGDQIDS